MLISDVFIENPLVNSAVKGLYNGKIVSPNLDIEPKLRKLTLDLHFTTSMKGNNIYNCVYGLQKNILA